jgi:hypothetical protein
LTIKQEVLPALNQESLHAEGVTQELKSKTVATHVPLSKTLTAKQKSGSCGWVKKGYHVTGASRLFVAQKQAFQRSLGFNLQNSIFKPVSAFPNTRNSNSRFSLEKKTKIGLELFMNVRSDCCSFRD